MVTNSIPEKINFKSICRNNTDRQFDFSVFSPDFGIINHIWTFAQTFEMSIF
jgi:hypothetical protein